MIRRFFRPVGFLLFFGTSLVSAQNYGTLPLRFEENRGQVNQQAKFQARGNGYQIFLTPNGATLALRPEAQQLPRLASYRSSRPEPASFDVVGLKFVGGTPNPKVTELDELPGNSSYLIGRDRNKWLTGLRSYQKIRYESVYPDTDLMFYGHGCELEFDFVLGPGADPSRIRLKLTGAKQIAIDNEGNVVLHASHKNLLLRAPVAYQQSEGGRRLVSARYLLSSDDELRFQLGPYDAKKILVIDPVLSYSTYLGGSNFDIVQNVAVDRNGFAYATGFTCSVDFPTVNPFQSQNLVGGCTVFVSKSNQSGSELVYSTYLGGTGGFEAALGIAVDENSDAYITGVTNSPDFPLENPFQTQNNGGAEAYVAELNSSGTGLVYSSFLGGSGDDVGLDIAVDRDGRYLRYW